MSNIRSLTLLAVLVMLSVPSPAKVREATIGELTEVASHVVIGRVAAVYEVEGVKVATVEVVQQVRGVSEIGTFTLLAEPTWTCDTSDSRQDEVVLLFLVPYEFDWERTSTSIEKRLPVGLEAALSTREYGLPLMRIAWSGRGRMPIKRRPWGEALVEFSEFGLELPRSIEVLELRGYPSWTRFASLADVIELVRDTE